MKVLVVSGMYHKPGAISAGFVHRQVCELRDQGVDVRVICPVARVRLQPSVGNLARTLIQRESTVEIDGVPNSYVPYWNVPHRISAGFVAESLRRALRRTMSRVRLMFDYEIVHANHLFPIGYAVQRVARELGIPVVIGARGSDVHTNPARNRIVARFTRATVRAGGVYAVSRSLARLVHSLGPSPSPIPVIYNGVDTIRFRPLDGKPALRQRLGLPEHGVGIAMVGRLVREKGVVELLQAFTALRTRWPDVWLVIVGDGPAERRIGAAIERQGLSGCVFLPGRRPHGELVQWLNAADVFTLPSYNEGLPNVVLEAMACGLPVVATDVGGVSEVVTAGVTGILVPPRCAAPLGAALERLLADPLLRATLGLAGLEHVRREFAWSRSASALLKLYEITIRGRAPVLTGSDPQGAAA